MANATIPHAHSSTQVPLAHRRRIETLVDLYAWGIATGRLWVVARAWLALERELHDA